MIAGSAITWVRKGVEVTAKTTGLLAEGFWATLRRLRDQWVLLVFLATALFWTRDLYERFVDLPQRVVAMQQAIGDLGDKIARLEQTGLGVAPDRSVAVAFPGTGHGIEDGQAGDFVTVRLAPVRLIRKDCLIADMAGYMIDQQGVWFSVESQLSRLPNVADATRMAFGVRIHPDMAPGRAQFLIEISLDCGTHLQTDDSPRLHFRVAPGS